MSRAPLAGKLFFDDMVKESWGFQGFRYTYDPKAVAGFSFRLRPELASGSSFALCIDRIGFIR